MASTDPPHSGSVLDTGRPDPEVTRRSGVAVVVAHPLARTVAGLALVSLAVVELGGRRAELDAVWTRLGHLSWAWVLPAVTAEALSFVCFALVQRHLLAAAGTQVAVAPLVGMTLATNSMAGSFPGGPAVSSVYRYRQYQRRGADPIVAAWAVVAVLVAAAISLALFAAVGVGAAVAGRSGAGTAGLAGALAAVVAVIAAAAALVTRPERFAEAAGFAARLVGRLTGRPARRLEAASERFLVRARLIRLGRRRTAAVLGWAMGNWACDCACLALAFAAVRVPVPWAGLLLAYGVGQLAAILPITPGGLGLVEGGLAVTLVTYGGGRAAPVVAAVLVYRAVSYWLALPVGWTAWAVIAAGDRRDRRSGSSPRTAPLAPPAVGETP
jgi:uncharacterized protein (TIRG00374 family)